MLDGIEFQHSVEHDDGTWLSVVSSPSSQSGEHPCGEGKRTFWVGVSLPLGFAFERLRDLLEDRLVFRIERIVERALGDTVAFVDELKHSNGGDETGCDEPLQRAIFGLAQRLDVEALRLQSSEQLFDRPAQAIEANDAARVSRIVDLMSGQQPPMGGGSAVWGG